MDERDRSLRVALRSGCVYVLRCFKFYVVISEIHRVLWFLVYIAGEYLGPEHEMSKVLGSPLFVSLIVLSRMAGHGWNGQCYRCRMGKDHVSSLLCTNPCSRAQ